MRRYYFENSVLCGCCNGTGLQGYMDYCRACDGKQLEPISEYLRHKKDKVLAGVMYHVAVKELTKYKI